MKTIYLSLILLTFMFTSCGKKEAVKEQKQKTDTVIQKTDKTIKEEGKSASKEEVIEGITDLKYDAKEYEKELKFNGKITASAQWKDKNGLNVIIITETKQEENRKSEYDYSVSKKFFAYGFIMKDKFEQEWMIQDFIDNCQVDLTLSYIPKSLSVTDLNNNGIAETTFLYKMSCKGDVSPNDLKLMMHEGKDKYAIRGETILKIQNEKPYGGSMKVDKSFDNAPKEFVDYAKKEFKKFQEEKLN
jgi:hypothetical protein